MSARWILAAALAGFTAAAGAQGVRAPRGLPAIPVPADNPVTRAKVELGRTLFMDRRLSHNNTLSCGMCHVPEQGFTSNELATAVGMEGQTVRRNSPTVYNVAYVDQLFHDGREFTLENQVWGPLLAGNEMANPSIGYVIGKIRLLPEYRGRFERAFGGRGPDVLTVGQALAAYQRTLVSGNSRFDRWRYGGERGALAADELAGYGIFTGKAGCSACHLVGSRHALFTDNGFHNTGVGYARSMGGDGSHRVRLAPGVETDVTDRDLAAFEPVPADTGRYEVTLDPDDTWKYRTPTLRNVALTAPYMHDGSIGTLEAVVEFYDRGGVPNPQLDPRVRPLALTPTEKAHLAAFLKSLTGDNVGRLAREARAAQPPDDIPAQDPAAAYRRR